MASTLAGFFKSLELRHPTTHTTKLEHLHTPTTRSSTTTSLTCGWLQATWSSSWCSCREAAEQRPPAFASPRLEPRHLFLRLRIPGQGTAKIAPGRLGPLKAVDDPTGPKYVGNHLRGVNKDSYRISLDTADGIPDLLRGRRKEGGGKQSGGESAFVEGGRAG